MTGPVLAHYGGVPEAALTLTLPLVVFGGFLLLERRARRRERQARAEGQEAAGGPDVPGS